LCYIILEKTHEHVKNLPPIWHVNIVCCCDLSRESRSRFLTLAWGTEAKSTFLWKTRVRKSHAVMYMNPDGPRGREANLRRPLPNNKTCSTGKKTVTPSIFTSFSHTKKSSVPVVVMVVLIGSRRRNNHFAHGPSFLLARFLHGGGSSPEAAWLQRGHKKISNVAQISE